MLTPANVFVFERRRSGRIPLCWWPWQTDNSSVILPSMLDTAGRGIGTRLFEQMEAQAREKGLHRLELTVMTHNQAGIALYKKMGFTVEGTKRHSLRVGGTYVDEYYMAKLLE